MRRTLLTSVPSGVALFTFGNATSAGTTYATHNYLLVDKNSVSPQAGTITGVTFYTTTATTFTVYVGSLSGSTFTIRGYADVASDGSGTQTATVAIPVSAGDYFGVWSPIDLQGMSDSTTGSFGYKSASTKPTSGAYALTAGTATLRLSLAGR